MRLTNNRRLINKSIEGIAQAVLDYLNLVDMPLVGQTRAIVYPRHLYCYICDMYTNYPQKHIARLIGKNRTAVVHSCETIENWIQTDENVRNDVEAISRILKTI